jgi:hypothetical protein
MSRLTLAMTGRKAGFVPGERIGLGLRVKGQVLTEAGLQLMKVP